MSNVIGTYSLFRISVEIPSRATVRRRDDPRACKLTWPVHRWARVVSLVCQLVRAFCNGLREAVSARGSREFVRRDKPKLDI